MSVMHEMTYMNNLGESVTFGGAKSNSWRFGETNLLDIDLDYDSTGGVITSFNSGIREFTLTVFMMRGSVKERNRFDDVVSYDSRICSPGTLYCGGSYIKCYFRAVAKSDWYQLGGMMAAECTLVSDEPVWIREAKKTLLSIDEVEIGGLNYPHDYPYDYLYSSGTSATLENPFRLPCKCDIAFPGPCVDPYVIIAGNKYQVKGSYIKGQLVIIKGFGNQKDILLRSLDGSTRSIFSSGVRTKEDHVFQPVPVGMNMASWSGAYNIEVTLYEERTSPYLLSGAFDV